MNIKRVRWNGLNAISFTSSDVVLTVVTDFGPRIAFFGRTGGRNLLFWDEMDRSRKDWKLRGGHRVWIMTPGADESETTYRPDNDPCTVEESGGSTTVWSALDPMNMTRRGIRVDPTVSGNFTVTSLVENAGEMLLACGIWTLTCTKPEKGTKYAFPLGDRTGWDTFKSVQFRRWGPCDGSFGDSQFQVGTDTLTVEPAGRQAKLMFCIPEGLGCMVDPISGDCFIKSVDYDSTAEYPGECNWAVYIGPDNYMVEFETMGPFSTLKPGDFKGHREIWSIKHGLIDTQSRSDIMKLKS